MRKSVRFLQHLLTSWHVVEQLRPILLSPEAAPPGLLTHGRAGAQTLTMTRFSNGIPVTKPFATAFQWRRRSFRDASKWYMFITTSNTDKARHWEADPWTLMAQSALPTLRLHHESGARWLRWDSQQTHAHPVKFDTSLPTSGLLTADGSASL